MLFLGLAALGATLSGAWRSPSTRGLAADGLATARAYLPHQQTATLAVRSAPPGATIEIDGRRRGTTPAEIPVGAGHHRARLRLAGHVAPLYRVHVDAGQTATVAGELWLESPLPQRLKPPLPGSTIVDATFLADGRLALVTSQHSGAAGWNAGGTGSAERQAWVVPTGSATGAAVGGANGGGSRSLRVTGPPSGVIGNPARIGPPDIRVPLAVSPDGTRVAYLARGAPTATPGTVAAWNGSQTGPTEVWVAPADGGVAERRFSLARPAAPATGAFGTAPPTAEQLVDLSWSADGTHLLLVARRGSGVVSATGAAETRLLWLDTTAANGGVRDVLTLPADVVPGSYSWNPAGDRVGFLARTSTGTALCVLDLSERLATPATRGAHNGTFRYLANVGGGGASGIPLLTASASAASFAIAPLTWAPDGTQAVYAAQAADASKRANNAGPFGLPGAGGPKLTTGLFLAAWSGANGTPADPAAAVFPAWAGRRLGTGQAPAVRADGTLVALGAGKRGEPVLRWMDARGEFKDVAPLEQVAARLASVSGVRWDITHGQAVLVLAAGGGQVEHWLVRFRGESPTLTSAPEAAS